MDVLDPFSFPLLRGGGRDAMSAPKNREILCGCGGDFTVLRRLRMSGT